MCGMRLGQLCRVCSKQRSHRLRVCCLERADIRGPGFGVGILGRAECGGHLFPVDSSGSTELRLKHLLVQSSPLSHLIVLRCQRFLQCYCLHCVVRLFRCRLILRLGVPLLHVLQRGAVSFNGMPCRV